MRSRSSLAIRVLAAALFLSCPDATGQPHAMKSPVVYEIFVQSFCDSNGDGIGDLRGIISRLDYIRGLGADAIWITPIHPSPSYHKYDITDYRSIHPQYGTPEDFDLLVRSVHDRGMKLIMDLVVNHTSWDHPWFKASASSKENPYRDYYVWRDYAEVEAEISKKSATFDSDNLTQWHEWPGDPQRYYGFFWKGMPDLNFDHPPVRQEVYAIAKYWLDKGVDGFRLDAAKHIYPDDEPEKTQAFWEEFRGAITAHKPDVLIFGEVWAEPETLAAYFAGMPSLFNFDLARAITETVRDGRADPLKDMYVRVQNTYAQNPSPLDDAILLSNHDMVRIRSAIDGDIAKAKLAASILLTLPGTAFIYYGEELGMLGGKPDEHLREPFPWTKASFAEKHWLAITQSTPDKVTPASDQMNDTESIYAHYKTWIALRHILDLGATSLVFLQDLPDGLIGWRLSGATGTYLAMHNLTDTEIKWALPSGARQVTTPILPLKEGEIKLPALTSIVIAE